VAVPNVPPEALSAAMERFDRELRETAVWADWEQNRAKASPLFAADQHSLLGAEPSASENRRGGSASKDFTLSRELKRRASENINVNRRVGVLARRLL
jgi:hypothetical protein